jgi:hypothetical protein
MWSFGLLNFATVASKSFELFLEMVLAFQIYRNSFISFIRSIRVESEISNFPFTFLFLFLFFMRLMKFQTQGVLRDRKPC